MLSGDVRTILLELEEDSAIKVEKVTSNRCEFDGK